MLLLLPVDLFSLLDHNSDTISPVKSLLMLSTITEDWLIQHPYLLLLWPVTL